MLKEGSGGFSLFCFCLCCFCATYWFNTKVNKRLSFFVPLSCLLPYVSSLLPKSRPRFPNLARGFQSLARDFRFKCLCLELYVFIRSISFRCECYVCSCVYTSLDGVADSIAAMGGACLLNMYVYATIIDYNNNTYNNNTHLISSHRILSLSNISIFYCSLSLSRISISISINIITVTSAYQHISSTSAAHQQHISSTSAAYQHISTSAHRHITTSSRSHQHHQHHIKLDPL